MHTEFLLLTAVVVSLWACALGVPLDRKPSQEESPLAGDDGAGRRKRGFGALHNYVDTVYDKSDYNGEWYLEDCESIFNCETVSQHHCNNTGRDYECSDNKGQCRQSIPVRF